MHFLQLLCWFWTQVVQLGWYFNLLETQCYTVSVGECQLYKTILFLVEYCFNSQRLAKCGTYIFYDLSPWEFVTQYICQQNITIVFKNSCLLKSMFCNVKPVLLLLLYCINAPNLYWLIQTKTSAVSIKMYGSSSSAVTKL